MCRVGGWCTDSLVEGRAIPLLDQKRWQLRQHPGETSMIEYAHAASCLGQSFLLLVISTIDTRPKTAALGHVQRAIDTTPMPTSCPTPVNAIVAASSYYRPQLLLPHSYLSPDRPVAPVHLHLQDTHAKETTCLVVKSESNRTRNLECPLMA